MKEAIEKIASYVDAMTFTDFQSDTRTVDAAVHNLLVIGEAARCLPASIKERHSGIDWIAINSLRNRIAHEYFGLSLSVIWEIVQTDLHTLRSSWRPGWMPKDDGPLRPTPHPQPGPAQPRRRHRRGPRPLERPSGQPAITAPAPG
jgi:uncharacterized protein with HEPN domain